MQLCSRVVSDGATLSTEQVTGLIAFVPGTGLSLRGAVGSTLMFRLIGRPDVMGDPEAKEKYTHHRHDYQDTELRVNGETYPAVEVCDTDLGIRVRAATVNEQAVIAVVPADRDVPGVIVTWPEGEDA